MAKFKCAVLFSLAVVLCGFCGCATRGSKPNVSDLYVLTVSFISPKQDVVHKIEIDIRPGVPFAVRTVDEAGNHYQVGGTLHEKANGKFEFEQGNASMKLAEGGGLGSGLPELELGKADSWGAVASVVWYGESVVLNKK
ncbi:MAG TPA: hypothetical protein VGO67_09250 [Verrucomicrobiae bacterium]|jgi:hypothetical protein